MSTISEFDTQSVHLWSNPQADTSAEIAFPHPFVAPPRLPHSLRELDIDGSTNIRAEATIEDITDSYGVYHITSWSDTTLYSGIMDSLNLAPANLEYLTGEHKRDLLADSNAPESVRIDFERPFVTPPKVLVFFNYIDLDSSKNWRLQTTATNIDVNGFSLNIETWSDTILYAAQACWIAYPEDREHIYSMVADTQDVRGSDDPQLQTSKTIYFDGDGFSNIPNVFVGLSKFDIDCGANFRIKAYVDNVSKTGLTWHLDTWSDSTLYSARAAIIAVN